MCSGAKGTGRGYRIVGCMGGLVRPRLPTAARGALAVASLPPDPPQQPTSRRPSAWQAAVPSRRPSARSNPPASSQNPQWFAQTAKPKGTIVSHACTTPTILARVAVATQHHHRRACRLGNSRLWRLHRTQSRTILVGRRCSRRRWHRSRRSKSCANVALVSRRRIAGQCSVTRALRATVHGRRAAWSHSKTKALRLRGALTRPQWIKARWLESCRPVRPGFTP